jgi:hypothetical protein
MSSVTAMRCAGEVATSWAANVTVAWWTMVGPVRLKVEVSRRLAVSKVAFSAAMWCFKVGFLSS